MASEVLERLLDAAKRVTRFLAIHKGGVVIWGGNDYEERRDAVLALHEGVAFAREHLQGGLSESEELIALRDEVARLRAVEVDHDAEITRIVEHIARDEYGRAGYVKPWEDAQEDFREEFRQGARSWLDPEEARQFGPTPRRVRPRGRAAQGGVVGCGG